MSTGSTPQTMITVSQAPQATKAQNQDKNLPPNVYTLPQTAQLEALYTIIRDKETSRGDFLFYSDRIIRLLVEEGLNHLPVVSRVIETPTVSHVPFRHIVFECGRCVGLTRSKAERLLWRRVRDTRALGSKARYAVCLF